MKKLAFISTLFFALVAHGQRLIDSGAFLSVAASQGIPATAVFAPTMVSSNSYNSGNTSYVSHTNTFPRTATSGNLLLLVVGVGNVSITNITAGWTQVTNATDYYSVALYYRVSAGTEASVVYTINASDTSAAYYMEIGGNPTTWTLDQYNAAIGLGPQTCTGPTTGTTTAANELAVAGFAWYYDNVSVDSWSNSFSEVRDVRTTSGSYSALGVAIRVLSSTGTYTTTAGLNTSYDGPHCTGVIATFK
jgi:hypothetical protein